jgi:hypothetical protein
VVSDGVWTLSGIAYSQVALTTDTLVEACAAIRRGDDAAAHDVLMSAIRQLTTAAELIR